MRSIPALDRRSGRMAAILRVTTIKHGPQVGERGGKLHEQITASSSNRTAPSASSLAKSETVASPAMERPVQVSCSIPGIAMGAGYLGLPSNSALLLVVLMMVSWRQWLHLI
jgi:hypothetical protein